MLYFERKAADFYIYLTKIVYSLFSSKAFKMGLNLVIALSIFNYDE